MGGEGGSPVLALIISTDYTAELLGDQLGAVADAENGNAEVEDLGIEPRGVLDMHAGRSTGQDDGGRLPFPDVGGGDAVADDFGVDLQLTNPAGDQLGVLSAEVDNQDDLAWGGHGGCVAHRALDRISTSAFWRSLRFS